MGCEINNLSIGLLLLSLIGLVIRFLWFVSIGKHLFQVIKPLIDPI